MKYLKTSSKSFKKQKKKRMEKRRERDTGKKTYKRRVLPEDLKNKHNNQRYNYNNCTHSTIKLSNDSSQLHHEITSFVSSIQPKKNDLIQRERTIALLIGIINSRFPKWTVKLFGSYSQGTQTYQSDLDFVITKDISDIISDNDQLQLIFSLLKRHKFGFNMRYIKAKVPIIKVICQSTLVSVDISVNKENGCQAAEIIQKQLKEEPGLRQMVIFLKYLLKSEGLNDASVGGMSSFVLFSLIFYFYQKIRRDQNDPVFIEPALMTSEQFDTDDEDVLGEHCVQKEAKLKEKVNGLNLGKFLFGFLKYFSYQFDNVNCGISLVNGGEIFYKYEHIHIVEHGSLCIENFQDCQIDIGRSCYHYEMIKSFFQRTLSRLQHVQQSNAHSYLKALHLSSS